MWTIWYVDNKLTGTTVQEWIDAPDTDVLAVYRLLARDEFGNLGHICLGSDWYWMLPDGGIGESLTTSDNPGEWVELNAPEGAHVKRGRWSSDERIQQVYDDLNALIEG